MLVFTFPGEVFSVGGFRGADQNMKTPACKEKLDRYM